MVEKKPAQPARNSSLDALEPMFLVTVRAFLEDCMAEDLPLWVFETRRSLDRQAWMRAAGVSRASGLDGPHPWGLAIDIVLDPKHASWPKRGGPPVRVGDSGAAWDTGVEVRAVARAQPSDPLVMRPQTSSCVVVRQGVHDVVARLGALAELRGLEWGGRNSGAWASHRPGDPFGFDAFHFQRRGWRALKASLPTPT